ncbi:MAG: hypothetical protein GY824_04930, partial [Delftia sp.]|nr:hypothetical protein [Delftia sp.]
LHVRGSARRRRRWFSALLGLVLGGITIGALRPTNTWDYLTYLALLPLALTVGYVTQRVGLQDLKLDFKTLRDGIVSVGGRFTLLAALSYIFFLPYVTNFATGSTGFEAWKGSKTPLWAYFGIHGLFLFPVITWLLLNFRGAPQKISAWLKMPQKSRKTLWALVILFALAMLTLFATVAGYQVALAVLPLGSLALLVLLQRETSPAGRLVALLSGVGLALTLWVEMAVLNQGDVGRMNTVFKFYLQVWVLFGVCAAACLGWIARNLARRFFRPDARWLAWLIVMALLVALSVKNCLHLFDHDDVAFDLNPEDVRLFLSIPT